MYRLIYLFLLLPCVVNAEVVETWTCTGNNKGEVLVTAYVNSDRETGKIKVVGVTHDSKFSIQGFERRWDFGLDKKFTYDYAFVIEPNGNASYYDFSKSKPDEIIPPSILMKCKMK